MKLDLGEPWNETRFRPYVGKTTHGSVLHTTLFSFPCAGVHTNDKSHILVKASPSTLSSSPQPLTSLGIRPQNLGLPNEYSLNAASRHKLTFTSRHYSLLAAT